jgi:hypothetical protein
VVTPHGGEGRGPGDTPGQPPRPGNRTPLIALGVVVIAVCVVVLFVLSSGGGSDATRLEVGDCVPADADGAVPCADAEATYRVVEVQEGVAEVDTPAACGAVPGVVAFGWEGEEGAAGTGYCLGPA